MTSACPEQRSAAVDTPSNRASRTRSLAPAASDMPPIASSAPSIPSAGAPAPGARAAVGVPRSRRRRRRSVQTPDVAASPSPSIIVGTAGGFVISDGDPPAAPTAAPPSSEPRADRGPSTQARRPGTDGDRRRRHHDPTARADRRAGGRTSPQPTAVALAVAGPDDTVATFYAHVVDGEFDAAYALWSERMRAAYPRQDNLDQRFDETASIEFQQLFVAEQAGDRQPSRRTSPRRTTRDRAASSSATGAWSGSTGGGSSTSQLLIGTG